MAPDIAMELRSFALRSSILGYLNEASKIDDVNGRIDKLQHTVRCLEEERRKIDAFKRELPLCMQLITDMIGMLREEMDEWRGKKAKGELEEFMPLKFGSDEKKKEEKREVRADEEEKKNWSSGLQLWSGSSSEPKSENKTIQQHTPTTTPKKNNDHASETKTKLSCGGAFVPFKAPPVAVDCKPLVSPDGGSSGTDVVRCGSLGRGAGELSGGQLSLSAQQQGPRKTRRCWSPELHRRFVIALQQLGGAQVATPKQIRELMKVDGLTNDEVKSHLQKYRLHTRKAPSNSVSASRSLAMIGNVWANSESYAASGSQQSGSQSGSPQSPLQLSGLSRVISATTGDSCDEEM